MHLQFKYPYTTYRPILYVVHVSYACKDAARRVTCDIAFKTVKNFTAAEEVEHNNIIPMINTPVYNITNFNTYVAALRRQIEINNSLSSLPSSSSSSSLCSIDIMYYNIYQPYCYTHIHTNVRSVRMNCVYTHIFPFPCMPEFVLLCVRRQCII